MLGSESIIIRTVPMKCHKCNKELTYVGNVYEWKENLYCEYCFDTIIEKVIEEHEYHGELTVEEWK